VGGVRRLRQRGCRRLRGLALKHTSITNQSVKDITGGCAAGGGARLARARAGAAGVAPAAALHEARPR
jgi:hypothetical protein